MKKTKLKQRSPTKLAVLRRQCDRALQEEGRRRYKVCEVCGKPMSCLHHFFPKSVSSRLRYEWDNLIPICVGCHFLHHSTFNPSVHATVIKKRGVEWYDNLAKLKEEIIKVNVAYYEEQLETLTNETTD